MHIRTITQRHLGFLFISTVLNHIVLMTEVCWRVSGADHFAPSLAGGSSRTG